MPIKLSVQKVGSVKATTVWLKQVGKVPQNTEMVSQKPVSFFSPAKQVLMLEILNNEPYSA